MRVRQRIMAILLTVTLLLTNTLSVTAAGETTEPVPENTPTATLTVEKVGEGTVLCTGDGITETKENIYSVPVGTVVTIEAQPSETYTTKQVLFNGSEVEGSFSMPETESTLSVVFEAIPKEEDTEEQPQEEESVDYVVNSKGIKVKKSLLCEDPNCLEEHVGKILQVSDLPVTSFVKDASMFGRSARIMEDVYVGMKTSGTNAQVAFWGTPGTGGVHEVKILDGGLSGVTGSGYCLNHGAANPGEGFWQVCTYEAECTGIEGTTATWQVTMTPPGAWDGFSYANGYPSGYQRVGMNVRVGFEEAKGTLEVHKSSSKPELTNGNSNYSLQGAVYGLYQNGVEVATATTNENAVATFQSIKKGDYVLKEITAPKGYALDETSHDVTIISGTTVTKNVTDIPQSDPVTILLGKVDAETNQNKPQGSASLEGAEFTIKYYATQSDTDPALSGLSPLHTWVVKTNQNGFAMLDEISKVSGDEFYYNSKGEPILPLGTITIQETEAPKGYLKNPEVFVRQITAEGTGAHVNTYNMPTVPETVQKGVIQLQKKSNETAIGTATLQGAEYEIRNAEGTVVDKLITNAEGKAQSKELPLGTYTVKEVKAPAQFLLDPETHTVELAATNTTDRVFTEKVASKEAIIRGNVEIIKVSENEDNPRGGLIYDTYTVTETKCPEGLKPIEPFKVTIEEEGVTLKGN